MMKINACTSQYMPSRSRTDRQSFKAVNASSVKKVVSHSYDRSTSWLAFGIGKLASFKPVQNVIDFLKIKIIRNIWQQ